MASRLSLLILSVGQDKTYWPTLQLWRDSLERSVSWLLEIWTSKSSRVFSVDVVFYIHSGTTNISNEYGMRCDTTFRNSLTRLIGSLRKDYWQFRNIPRIVWPAFANILKAKMSWDSAFRFFPFIAKTLRNDKVMEWESYPNQSTVCAVIKRFFGLVDSPCRYEVKWLPGLVRAYTL